MRAAVVFIIALVFSVPAFGADVNMTWDAVDGATGYRVYASTDQGQTWDTGVDVGNVTTYLYQGVPDTGLILFRASAYNGHGETVQYKSGCWYNGGFAPPVNPGGLGIQ